MTKPSATLIMSDMRHVLAPGVHTYSACDCGRSWRRGSHKCPDCQVNELAGVVGRDLAVRYLAAIKVSLDLEGQIKERAGE